MDRAQQQSLGGSRLAVGLIAVTIVLIGASDLLLEEGINVGILYGVPLLACAWVGGRKALWGLTALALFLSVGLMVLQSSPSSPDFRTLLLNRLLAAVALVGLSAILHFLIGALSQVRQQNQRLESTNAALGSVNAALAEREQVVARQNETLQAQSDRFERQGQELTQVNRQLANRESTLQHLVELSRGITADIHRQQMLHSVCQATLELLGGVAEAVAVLERQDGQLIVRCRTGVGIDGKAETRLAFAGSFAAQVIDSEQTAYLEDTWLRPDLSVLPATDDRPFRSVLGTPLWVRGRCIGTLQVYARQPTVWSGEQVSLIQSLGAQTSISLETVQLIENLEQERRRFEAVFRTMPIGVIVADDPSCRFVRGNPAVVAMYQASPEANFSPMADVGPGVQRTLLRDGQPLAAEEFPLIRAVRLGQYINGEELEALLPNGRHLHLLVSAAPILDAQGQITGGVSAMADITMLKHLQQQIEQRRRDAEETAARKTRFLAAVSHDIRTPANAINLLAELIRRSAGNATLAQEVPQLAQDLQSASVALVELVSDVLDLTRLEVGGVDLQESEFSLGQMIAEEARHHQVAGQQKGLSIQSEVHDGPLWVCADRVKLGRVIANLVSNAIKFTERGGVTLRAAVAEDGRPQVQIIDTGVGIPSQYQGRIFDEFFQLHNPDRDQRKGIGLGLAICARLMQAMGGQISVSSTPGRGSTFTLHLPVSALVRRPPTPASPSHSAEPRPRLAGLRVLLVEDHDSTRRATTQLLTNLGAEVAEAATGESGLRLLYERQPQVLLLDLMLPDLDGAEILKAIAARRPESLRSVLVLTGDMTPDRVDEVRRLGADALIAKPIDLSMLISHMRRALTSEAAVTGK